MPFLSCHACLLELTSLKYAFANPFAEVPTLAELAIRKLADHCDCITDISCLPEMVTIQLLQEIMLRQKLTFALAKVFMNSGHDDICRYAFDTETSALIFYSALIQDDRWLLLVQRY